MIPRLTSRLVADRLSTQPAVAVVGPRQCGKTTLARSLDSTYFDLEQESERLRLDLHWEAVLASGKLVVLDEAQSWPEVFPRLRGAIDGDRKRNGRFLLLGSVSPALMTKVSESLAGRLALVELSPLLLRELAGTMRRSRLWLMGGFPDGGVLARSAFPAWQDDYMQLLVQRDLPNWGLPARPQTTSRFVHMLAAVSGQQWKASQLGKSLGISYHTVNSYLDYLVGAFLVRVLPPYESNLRKRLVKSPKVYWRDSGLLHALLNISDEQSLLRQPWVGASWEGFVIEQILSHLAAVGHPHRAYSFRTSDQYEADLVLEFNDTLWVIEVKLSTMPSTGDMDRLDKIADLIGASHRALVSQTPVAAGDGRRTSCDLAGLLDLLLGPAATN